MTFQKKNSLVLTIFFMSCILFKLLPSFINKLYFLIYCVFLSNKINAYHVIPCHGTFCLQIIYVFNLDDSQFWFNCYLLLCCVLKWWSIWQWNSLKNIYSNITIMIKNTAMPKLYIIKHITTLRGLGELFCLDESKKKKFI